MLSSTTEPRHQSTDASISERQVHCTIGFLTLKKLWSFATRRVAVSRDALHYLPRQRQVALKRGEGSLVLLPALIAPCALCQELFSDQLCIC
jgi:hypothetical protein